MKHTRTRGDLARESIREEENAKLESVFLEGFKTGISGGKIKDFAEIDVVEKKIWLKGYNKGKEKL